MLALKEKGGTGKKFLKGRGSIQKGVPLLKGVAGKVKIKIFMTKFKAKNIAVMGIFRHSRDAKFKIFSNHGGIMPKP